MDSQLLFRLLADVLLALHIGVIVFVIGGLLVICAGKILEWSWVRNRWFRFIHLFTILFIVVQSWAGKRCFLTDWEMALRTRAGDTTYSASFIAYWMDELLYYDAPFWIFVTAYTLFGALVVFSWFWVRPSLSREKTSNNAN